MDGSEARMKIYCNMLLRMYVSKRHSNAIPPVFTLLTLRLFQTPFWIFDDSHPLVLYIWCEVELGLGQPQPLLQCKMRPKIIVATMQENELRLLLRFMNSPGARPPSLSLQFLHTLVEAKVPQETFRAGIRNDNK
eukprot:scaffold14558_cov137-Cylindrotheca_fusiformis.AAC.9